MPSVEDLCRYYNFGRYLFIVPFTVRRNSKTGRYSCLPLKWPFKFFPIMVQATSIVMMLAMDWIGVQGDQTIRSLVYTFFNIFGTLGLLKLHTGAANFERLVNDLSQIEMSREQPAAKNCVKRKSYLVRFVMLFVVGYSTMEVLFYYIPLRLGFYGAFQLYFKNTNLVLKTGRNCTYFGPDGCEISNLEMATSLVTFFSAVYALILVQYLKLLCFMHSHVLLSGAKNFLFSVKSSASRDSKLVISKANRLIDLSKTMEDAMGSIVLTFCLALIPYYAHGMQAILNLTDFAKAARYLVNSATFIVILITAAEANSKMKKVGSQIALRTSAEKNDKVVVSRTTVVCQSCEKKTVASLMLLQRLNSNEFGLHGKAFTINYGLVGNVAGLVITYSIILYQFQDGSSGFNE